jgi:16S rRNA C967 or C1407 C5-methylase (RsmB/RsmF family)/NOL1/NOP2/fmu family ribosome biogenesis protein
LIIIAEMLPEDFIKRLDSQKYIDKEALLKAMEEPSPVSIRTNPAKWNKKPVDSEPVEWCSTGYYLPSRPSYTLDPLYHSGCYYPQEASSMFLEQVFRQVCDSSVGLKVLDLCGAPGGKSTHLSNLIGDSGLLVANEVIRSRAQILAESLTKWGKGNFLVTQNDPSQFTEIKGYFDVIVVDAPCSGEGMFRTDVAVSEWSGQNASHCSERQKRIVMDVWPALKEGGILIYSTCTFNPEENEENIKWLTGRNSAESLRLDISMYKGLNEIDFHGVFGYGFYPDRISGEGFFISAIRKLKGEETKTSRVQRFQELKPSRSEIDTAVRWSHFSGDRLMRRGDDVIALPCSMENYLQLFHSLTVIRAGTKLFTVKKNDSLPSHELAISGFIREGAFPGIETDLHNSLAYLRRDNLNLKPENLGWNLLSFNRINIGFINNIGNRINNYFPVEWRIRMDLPKAGNENLIKWEMYGNSNP